MEIREEGKGDVLQDVAPIIMKAIDLEIKAQSGSRKRKFAPKGDDPAHLSILVTEFFAKMGAGGEVQGKFRFRKKRKMTRK